MAEADIVKRAERLAKSKIKVDPSERISVAKDLLKQGERLGWGRASPNDMELAADLYARAGKKEEAERLYIQGMEQRNEDKLYKDALRLARKARVVEATSSNYIEGQIAHFKTLVEMQREREAAHREHRPYDGSRVTNYEMKHFWGRGGKKERGLARTAATTAIIGIIGGLFFFSTSMTGNVIGNLTVSGEKVIGSIFVLVALVGAFFWMRSK